MVQGLRLYPWASSSFLFGITLGSLNINHKKELPWSLWVKLNCATLRLKIAQKPYIVWSLGPKALNYESLEP